MISLDTFHSAYIAVRTYGPNPEQRQTVDAGPADPLFIVAGPGTGKTTVLVLRILKLILVDGIPPNGILATTFTVKAAAELLHEREIVRSAQWTRPDGRVEDIAGKPFERELEVDLFSLLQAFQAVLSRTRDRPPIPLPEEVVPIESRIEELLTRLATVEACGFEELFADASSRRELITTFLAVLEMIRLRMIRVFQQGTCGPIRVYARLRPAVLPHPIKDSEQADAPPTETTNEG